MSFLNFISKNAGTILGIGAGVAVGTSVATGLTITKVVVGSSVHPAAVSSTSVMINGSPAIMSKIIVSAPLAVKIAGGIVVGGVTFYAVYKLTNYIIDKLDITEEEIEDITTEQTS